MSRNPQITVVQLMSICLVRISWKWCKLDLPTKFY